MFTVKEETTLVGLSELRTHLNDILNTAKEKNIILTKRNKPVLAVINYKRYQQITELLEEVEDLFLENLAQQRLERKDKKTIPLAEAMKRVGL
ncbi:MAG: type II toxin-antitoxin system prevent-host-death family antitoxin [bacterium]|nr:type II toxin-antitoxin system prevent-host-death family antitoxin [bacterium]